jgi:hypothetical protein
LEIIHRLPCTEALKPYVEPILATVTHLLEVESEEPGVLCLKILLGASGLGGQSSCTSLSTAFLGLLVVSGLADPSQFPYLTIISLKISWMCPG